MIVLFIFIVSVLLVLLHIKKNKFHQLYVKHYFYELVLKKTNDVIFIWDFQTKAIQFSKNHIHCEEEYVLYSIFNDKKEDESKIKEVQLKNFQGIYNWYSIVYEKIFDNCGNLSKVVGMISNIENEKQKLFEIQKQAMCDSMTCLYNRSATQNLIQEYLEREQNTFGIMMIIDIDNFKQINDSMGHAKGDKVIVKMSEVLRTFFRKTDIVGRIGGDEFLVFLPNLNSDYDVKKRATELLLLLEDAYETTNGVKGVSCSLGIASYPCSGTSFQELYEAADLLLYKAKKKGKNTYVTWKD